MIWEVWRIYRSEERNTGEAIVWRNSPLVLGENEPGELSP